jgi:hypothetical protein
MLPSYFIQFRTMSDQHNEGDDFAQQESVPGAELQESNPVDDVRGATAEQIELVQMGHSAQMIHRELEELAHAAQGCTFVDNLKALSEKAHWLQHYGNSYQKLWETIEQARVHASPEHRGGINPFFANTGFGFVCGMRNVWSEIQNPKGSYGSPPATGVPGNERGATSLERDFQHAYKSALDMPNRFRRYKDVIGALNAADIAQERAR